MSQNSNIRVFVQWSEQTVFAGENIECQITFRNIAVINKTSKPLSHPIGLNGYALTESKQRKTSALRSTVVQNRNYTSTNIRTMPISRGHRATLPSNMLVGETSHGESVQKKGSPNEAGVKERPHRRSVSIVSLGITEGGGDEITNHLSLEEGSRYSSRGHARASSLQIIPRRSGASISGPLSASLLQKSTTHPSQLFRTTSSPKELDLRSDTPSHNKSFGTGQQSGIIITPNTSGVVKVSNMQREGPGSGSLTGNFRFPAASILQADQRLPDIPSEEESLSPLDASISNKLSFPRSREDVPTIMEQAASSIRIISTASSGETPRSSGDFYSLSNNSTETLASEYPAQHQSRTQSRVPHIHRSSNFTSVNQPRPPETLMMGYAHVCGSFTLDSSLISQAPFEDVKRKGVLGGQGGGVIGLETGRRESGLLRNLGWGNLGESLGGFLGGNELSSIKDMRGTANSRFIPLLSTPQSILFVDLRLGPGESRSYKYSFKLPSGLPPSHRGKAIKIAYNLIIGTQRQGSAREHQVKAVEVPFRVLGSVNEHGEPLGHDLMSPYIILRDQAWVQCLDNVRPIPSQPDAVKVVDPSESTLNEFLDYVNGLLLRPRQSSAIGLLSPTEVSQTRRPSGPVDPRSVKESIDMAILRSNLAIGSQRSANRFEISRNGQRVAVIMLARPAYRLGETIAAAIDFTNAEIPCYALYAALETSEKVDPAIALRSDATIHRVTRRTYSSHSESTLFARRVIFRPTIPVAGTPGFTTSSVSLEWKILIEFVTPNFESCTSGDPKESWELLEEVSRDGRNMVRTAIEGLGCESFEIAVPIRVYGALTDNTDRVGLTEGLAV